MKRNPVFLNEVAGRRLLVLTSKQGANRVYTIERHEVIFAANANPTALIDTAGHRWQQTESALTRADGAVTLPRFVAQRAFWFGWFAQYPQTLLLGQGR